MAPPDAPPPGETSPAERRFRKLVGYSSDVIVVVAPDARIRWISPSVETVLGHTPEALLGLPAQSLVHPDDVPRAWERVIGDGAVPSDEPFSVRAPDADGEWRHLRVRFADLSSDPDIEGFIFTIRDVSQEVESETARQRLSMALEASTDLVGMLTLADGKVSMNRAGLALLGLDEASVHPRRPHHPGAPVGQPPGDPRGRPRPRGVRPVGGRARRPRRRGRCRAAVGGDGGPARRRAHRLRRRGRAGHQRAQGVRGPARAPGHPRPAHRPAQPHPPARPPAAWRWPAPAGSSPWPPSCSSTSTTSRSSTTAWATPPATPCWSRWPPASRAPSAPATPWPASAATSSPCCARTWPTGARRSRSPPGSRPPWPARWCWRAPRSPSRCRSGWPAPTAARRPSR